MTVSLSRRDVARLTKELVVGGFNSSISGLRLPLPWSWDDLTNSFGRDIYNKMMLDPQVSSNVAIFKASIIEEGLTIAPAVLTKDADGYDKSKMIADEAISMFKYMDSALDDVLWDMMDQVIYGSRVAELKYYLHGAGSKQRLDIKDIKPKPQENTAFICDKFMNIVGLLGNTNPGTFAANAITSETEIIPRNKFLVMTFRPKDKDPRGTSLIRTSYDPWWRKRQVIPEYMKFLSQFASPSVIGKTPENAEPAEEPEPGEEAENPVTTLLKVLLEFRNSSALVVPFGTEIDFTSSEGTGEAFRMFEGQCNHDITKAILTQELATEESKFQARAAAQVHQGILDTLIRQAKRAVIRAFEHDVIVPWIVYNWGEETARSLCPNLTLGTTEQAQLAPLITAVAALERAGYIDDDQRADIDKILGLPIRPSNRPPKPLVVPVAPADPNAEPEENDDDEAKDKQEEKVAKTAAIAKRNLEKAA